ncbi:MAG: holdfast anchor protein HfaD [Brevundimonas sp.]|uniref:holdfast anchor protein HfaD n=1 Tax=Brevundimonas sp. TaxID=1871086 RepID=UPI002735FC26|nr:holdfast anchor protein HfaD [Brevundimonas sp.]MDP3378222.1 holdfast anchor protein HfaD [Brevundimonas sp.]
MARLVPIRLAGMIAATVTCAAVATEAAAQDQDPSVVLNEQIQFGDVFAGQTLDVFDSSDQVTVSNSATGNSLAGGVQGGEMTVRSTQSMQGDVRAETTFVLGGDTEGVVNAVTQANGNYLGLSAYDANLTVESAQTVGDVEIVATSTMAQGNERLLGGAYVDTSAIGNTAALGGERSYFEGTLTQTSGANIRASNYAATQYIPAEAAFTAQAVANVVAVTGTSVTGQRMTIDQTSTGGIIDSGVSANAGNAWDLAGRANAGGNRVVLSNQGGSVVASTRQNNTSQIQSQAIVTSYDYGAANSYARGVANEVSVGNNDIYVEIDNTQINTGGVAVNAQFAGTQGYDAYVGADAAGNVVTGFACADCAGYINATNSQANNGNVSATAQTTINGTNRAVVTGTNAVGNAATFYVSRGGN